MDNEKVYTIALAGNPNVGKSTVFNALTGLNQHTGNWPGKTVSTAKGTFLHKGSSFTLVDIPGMYSLIAGAADEDVARDFICFENPDCTVIVTDATCLERNLNLVLQILEVTQRVVVCVNLLDEAKKKNIEIDLDELSLMLGVPVVGVSARSGKGIDLIADAIYDMTVLNKKTYFSPTVYPQEIEEGIAELLPVAKNISQTSNPRWMALRLLDVDSSLNQSIKSYLNFDPENNYEVCNVIKKFKNSGLDSDRIRDLIVQTIVTRANGIYKKCVKLNNENYTERDRKLDRFLTSRATGIPVMLLLLAAVFWITISGANYPSQLLSDIFNIGEDKLHTLFESLNAPGWLDGLLISGMYRTLTWVVSVMLPPMAIFFPLFTLLEDLGYLPRIAFNLDKYFKKAGAHGKQSLTMCMGLGCNACGVTGCRIINSPRERIIAIVTNNFVPCNGRFPTLIAIISIFFTGSVLSTPLSSALSALILLGVIVLGVAVTLLTSSVLSKTLLKGVPSAFALELPPYRRPQIGKVIVRSIFDRTLFVLGRAVIVAAPAGILIWVLSNIEINDLSLLAHCTEFLDPLGKIMGLDGVILLAFILGLPANEIVLPIIIMSYMGTGSITGYDSLASLSELLTQNGWNLVTAICFMLFSLMHFPCATTCITIYKETKSLKWTALSILLPTAMGILFCVAVNLVGSILGY